MWHKTAPLAALLTLLALSGCQQSKSEALAYGNFEAEERIISAQANGELFLQNLEEGSQVAKDSLIGFVDTSQLGLRSRQLLIQIGALGSRRAQIGAQDAVLGEQLQTSRREKERFARLLKDSAATSKQFDDLAAQERILQKQRQSNNTQLLIVADEQRSLEIERAKVQDQIKKSLLKAPCRGTILNRYQNTGEITSYGKPICKLADLSRLYLRAYIDGRQLSSVRLGQEVRVRFDGRASSSEELLGRVSYISDQAEFTPKIIQTAQERTNLVYAIKVEVKNDGRLKIGMPGEIWPGKGE